MKISKPNRNDLKYKEIESFEVYEITPCIAYEMAIRNNEVQRLLSQSRKPESNNKELKQKLLAYGFDDIASLFFFDRNICSDIGDGIKTIAGNGIVNFKANWIDTEEAYAFDNKNEMVRLKKSHLDLYRNLIIFHKIKRPKLTLPKIHEYKVDINFALPEKEILSYVKKIRDSVELNNKTSLEKLISDDLASSEKRLSKSYADMFFAYDYFEYCKTINENKDKEAQDKIAQIKENHKNDLDMSQRNFHIDNIKVSYANSKQSSKDISFEIEEIINPKQANNIDKSLDDPNTKNIRATTTERHLAAMRKYIDQLEYKELLTGTSLS